METFFALLAICARLMVRIGLNIMMAQVFEILIWFYFIQFLFAFDYFFVN